MIRPMLKRFIPQAVAWVAVIALCGVIAVAQDTGKATSTAPSAGQRTDGQIEMDVVHALDASAALKNDLITAATVQGEVTLSGTVSSDASRELAESLASRVTGVTALHNNLKVGNPANSQDAQPAAGGDSGADQPADNQAADTQQNDGPMPPPQGYPQVPPPDQGQAQQPYPGQAQPPYPSGRPQYAPNQGSGQGYNRPPATAYEKPTGPVAIPMGTLLQVRTTEPVDSKRAKDGTPVDFTVIHDVAVNGVLAIPRGATVHGVVTESKKSGDLAGSPELALRLTSLDLGGQSYPLDSDQFRVKGPNKAGHTFGNAFGGAILGALIGGAVDRGAGAAIGAGAGAGAGIASSAASGQRGMWIPAEALVSFHLKTPVTVNPVSAREAARLAQGLYPGGPNLYRRGYYRPGYPYGSPYYANPPVYYRPYYMTGGYYYWR
jgi:hypothetical protein